MTPDTHLRAEEWPIKALIYTRPLPNDRWESRIICMVTPGALCSQEHYKTTGQYENHLLRYHQAEVQQARRQYWAAMTGKNQAAPPLLSPGHQGLAQHFNGAALPFGVGTHLSPHMISADMRVLPSVENETSISSPATLCMSPGSGSGSLASPLPRNGTIAPSPNPPLMRELNGASLGQLGMPGLAPPGTLQGTPMSPINGRAAAGTGGGAVAPSTSPFDWSQLSNDYYPFAANGGNGSNSNDSFSGPFSFSG
ncbi:hypothetical protein EKO27_g6302 [Xylaria grammica]|uniref:Uncharacterized protein n=1 Tax=Xylaria grammica TaxID=363999 RepID=A0A439D326_9PEZI|nr:hypothetical protein EKO27_g6302 [Xylaria grammica]